MSRSVLVDAGPLVAILLADDRYHESCVQQFAQIPHPLLTTWVVLAEAAHLLKRYPLARTRLLQSLDEGIVEPIHLDRSSAKWIETFLDKYRDQRPDLADATLVYLAERHGISRIFTLDRRDFSIYRTTTGDSIQLLPEVMN